MRNRTLLFAISSVLFIFTIGSPEKQMTDQEKIDQKSMENYLGTAEIISVRELPEGRTGPWQVRLKDKKIEMRAIFKHINNPRPALFLAGSYKYEIAAYELDKLLHLNIIPPVVEREINGVKGSLQVYIENFMRESERKRADIEPLNPVAFQNIMELIKIFENLTYCKHDSMDIFIQKKDWKVWRVDFHEAFSPLSKLFPDWELSSCPEEFYQNFLKLDENKVHERLKPYLNNEEIAALLARKKLIMERLKQVLKEKEMKSLPSP